MLENSKYDTFELHENLQYLDEQTLGLLSKGFIEKIINEDTISQIEESAKSYRELWRVDLFAVMICLNTLNER